MTQAQLFDTPSLIDDTLLNALPSPCWVIEEHLLRKNLEILKYVSNESGAKILLALKAFAPWKKADIINEYLSGCCASGLNEAKLAREEFGKEVHTYSPAFKESDIDQIASLSDHLVFNSPSQLHRYHQRVKEINPNISIGLRVNPQYSEAPVELYNPCAPHSRLGTLDKDIDFEVATKIEGLHFHTLCEQDSDALENTLKVFTKKFGRWLPLMKWVNFGGGHHITRDGYDIDRLIHIIKEFKKSYPQLQIYLEPGEAVGWQTGVLVATVIDIVHNGIDIAILDTSTEAHMPDTVIMPYKATVRGASKAGKKAYTYRLTGNTCLAGDIMGDYSFDKKLEIGSKIIFEDQMHYTIVKATTFNGINLPAIAMITQEADIEIIRMFGYEDFKSRLG